MAVAVGILAGFSIFAPLLFMPWKYLDLDPEYPALLPLIRTEPVAGIAPGRNNCSTMQAYLRSLPGNLMLAENAGAAILANKATLVSDMFIYAQLFQQSPSSVQSLDGLIRTGQVDWILTAAEIPAMRRYHTDRWPTSLLDTIEANYTLRARFVCSDARALYARRIPPAATMPVPEVR
jgi:hypothetical protein